MCYRCYKKILKKDECPFCREHINFDYETANTEDVV